MKAVLLALTVAGLLAGCATPEVPLVQPSSLFVDRAFGPPGERINVREAIALSPALKEFAEGPMASAMRIHGMREGFVEALNSRSKLRLDYDASRTRTAAEAFEARSGNCLSLVLMTAALAQHLKVPLRFNGVVLEDTWTRNAGLYFVTGHVNVSLAKPLAMPGRSLIGEPELLTIDFIPPELLKGQRSRVISEETVLAMYANNRAAEALTVGRVDEAYWWTRAALDVDPRWLSAYNTLAVLYRRKGLGAEAEAVLRFVLEREPLNLQALSNLVLVVSDAGRRQEAQALADQLAQIQPIPPYHFFDQGLQAMRAGKFEEARGLFSKEIARSAFVSEFHFWHGLAQWGLGNPAGTRAAINQDLEYSATPRDRQLYTAKLAWLDEQRSKAETRRR